MQRGDGDGDQAWDVVAASLLHPHLQLVAAVSTQQVPGHSARQQHRLGIYLFIYYLKAYSPVNRTGSPRGFSLVQVLQKSHKISQQKGHLTANTTHVIHHPTDSTTQFSNFDRSKWHNFAFLN